MDNCLKGLNLRAEGGATTHLSRSFLMPRIQATNREHGLLKIALIVMTFMAGHGTLMAQFRAPNTISSNVTADSYCLGTDLFENLHIAYVTEGVLNLHTLLADGRVTDLLVAADSAQPDLDFFSVSLHLAYLHRTGADLGYEVWYSAQVGQALRAPERVSRAEESCNKPAIEVDLRGNPFFAWESYTGGGETVIRLASLAGSLANLGPGQSPDLVVDQQQNIHVFFLRDGVIHYTSDVTSAEPRTFPSAAPVFENVPGPHTAPKAVLAGRSTIYLAFAAEGIVHLANNTPAGFSDTRLIDTAVTGSPSIHIGTGRNLALSYQKDGTVYYLSGSPDDLPVPRAIIDEGENHLAPVISTDTFGNHPVLFQREDSLMMTTNASPPTAAFSIDRLSGIVPVDIQLRDESEGDITAWLWTFGDGTASVLSDPGHTYAEVGEYEINLTVIGPGGRSSTGLDQAIEVTESQNRIWVDDVRVFPGMESVYIPVELAHDVPVQALQVAATFDPAHLEITSVDFLLTNIRSLGAELLAYNISNDSELPYVTSGIIFDIEPPYDGRTLPPGENQRILNIVADVSPDAPTEGSTVVRLANGVGEPPLENILTVDSMTVLPRIGKPGTVFFSPAGLSRGAFVRGDADSNGVVNISDAVVILGYLFLGDDPVECLDAGDANDSGTINVADAAYSLNFLFRGGMIPPPPFPNPGLDPSDDQLSCDD